ncbi:hypothetical protein [Agrobacterium tumefaciens]|uniref:hypothetical protein n=1 Tax=Agrobacterium tumefaciens TaxID=358 RepID=UPI00045A4799|nr:hypothetical protein [Agrobacterium tumefaciens]CDN96074.1 hypothetical protein BN949_05249 [Agrobacterium tumefaciens]
MSNKRLRDAMIVIMNDRMRHMETLQDLEASGLSFVFDDGRTIEDAIAEEDRAICNLQSAIDRLMD